MHYVMHNIVFLKKTRTTPPFLDVKSKNDFLANRSKYFAANIFQGNISGANQPLRANRANFNLCHRTTGKPKFAECLGLCRELRHGHSAKTWFAECQATSTRQTSATRHTQALPSAGRRQKVALGNMSLLPSAGPAALGKDCARAQHARPPCAAR